MKFDYSCLSGSHLTCVHWSRKCRKRIEDREKLNRICLLIGQIVWFLLHHCISIYTIFIRTTACSNLERAKKNTLLCFLYLFALHFIARTISDHFLLFAKQKKWKEKRFKNKNEISFYVKARILLCGRSFVCIGLNLIFEIYQTG